MSNTKVEIKKISTTENLFKLTQNITDTMRFQII
jgi:hypothetical protein